MNLVIPITDFAYWLFIHPLCWIVCALSLTSLWAMGSYRAWGPWLGLFSEVFWVILGIFTGQPSLLFLAFVFAVVHLRNGLKWRREQHKVVA